MKKTELEVKRYGNPALRKKCRKVQKVNSEVKEILKGMINLMRKEKGVGLAANQAGFELALVVVETPEKLYKLINPKITKKKGKIVFEEGCLSFPEINLSIKRAKEVWVNFLNEEGRKIHLRADGTLAVILQHEIDHINGVLFIDRVSFFKKLKIKPKLKVIA